MCVCFILSCDIVLLCYALPNSLHVGKESAEVQITQISNESEWLLPKRLKESPDERYK